MLPTAMRDRNENCRCPCSHPRFEFPVHESASHVDAWRSVVCLAHDYLDREVCVARFCGLSGDSSATCLREGFPLGCLCENRRSSAVCATTLVQPIVDRRCGLRDHDALP